MEKIKHIFRTSGNFTPNSIYSEVGTRSTEDLNEGFGKKFMVMTMAKNDSLIYFNSVQINECLLDVSVEGLKLIDREEHIVQQFEISKIAEYKCSYTADGPSFVIMYDSGAGMDVYRFETPQAPQIRASLEGAIEMALNRYQPT